MGRRALAAALAVRLAVALAIRTAFAPDEYWQSIEVAHRLVFGYGHLTWEWAAGLRSYAHPLLFAVPYAALGALRLDSPWTVVRVPLLLQALVAAAADMYVFRLAALVLGGQAARWCLVCQLASWFNAYCLSRTYSNSIEAALAVAGTYHWLCCRAHQSGSSSSAAGSSNKGSRSGSGKAAGKNSRRRSRSSAWQRGGHTGELSRRHQRAWVACAALSVVFRPSSALFWALPAVLELARQRGRALWALLADAVALGGGILSGAAVVDRICYGRWVAVPWEFFRFNLLAGASAQYGGHPWHWNLTQGLPTVAASLLPLLVAGLAWAAPGAARQPALLAAWSLAAYSLPAHKEFRFLLPALQLLMPYCGLAAARLLGGSSISSTGGGSGSASKQAGAGTGSAGRCSRGDSAGAAQPGRPRRWWRWGAAACLLLQLPMAAYVLLLHQGAQVGVIHLIQREAAARQPGATTVLFLTPCHATPYHTHVHMGSATPPIPMRFLDCSPPQHAAATAALNRRGNAWLPLPATCPAGAHSSNASGGNQAEDGSATLSQRQCFERDPRAYLAALFDGGPGASVGAPLQPHQRPRLLVGYAPLMAQLADALGQWGYRLHSRLRNCWVQTDDDSPCELQLWELQ